MAGPWEKYAASATQAPSGPWEKYAESTPAESWGTYGYGLLEKAGQGATFGFGDEIAAAAGTVGNKVMRAVGVDVPKRSYDQTLAEIRGEQHQFEDRHPYQGIAAEVAGGAAPFILGGPARAIMSAPSWAGRIGRAAAAGAGYGAVSGFGSSEGGLPERAEGALGGAAAGAVLGPVASEIGAPIVGAVIRGVKSGGQGLAAAVRAARSRGANIDARLNNALEAQNTPPGMALRMLDEAQQSAKFGKTQIDPRMTIADLGPVTRDLADTAALVSPEARGISGRFLWERARGQFGRTTDYLQRAMGVTRGDFAKTKANLLDEQSKLSKTAYDAFRSHDVRIPVGDVLYNAQVEDMAAAPALKKTLERAREQFIGDRIERDVADPATGAVSRVKQAYTELTPARFDAGKRALDDMINEAQRGGRNNEVRLLAKLKNDLVAEADKATTVPQVDPKTGQPVLDAKGKPQTESLYAKARDVYGSRADMLDSLESGRAFMRGDSEMTGAQYKELSTAEKRMFRIGVAREVRKALGAKGLNSDMIGYFDRPNTRDVLEEIMTKGQAKKFYDLIELEQGLAATNTAVRGNSATARRQQNVLDFGLGTRLGRMIKDQGLRAALSNEVFDQVTKFFAMRGEDAVALTRAMFETDHAAQRATLNRLAQTYGKGHTRAVINRAERAARQRMALMRRSIALGVTGEMSGDAYSKKRQPPEIGYAQPGQ